MPSPNQRRQKKVLLREQEREEILEVLPIEVEEEEEAPKTKISKKVNEIFTAFADNLNEDKE